ncbi:hypothetical protein SUGI_0606890 [Cryptomeria japonica]|nr:hypothetical protein SUGI_0606890 [Cryptomeria japonica]
MAEEKVRAMGGSFRIRDRTPAGTTLWRQTHQVNKTPQLITLVRFCHYKSCINISLGITASTCVAGKCRSAGETNCRISGDPDSILMTMNFSGNVETFQNWECDLLEIERRVSNWSCQNFNGVEGKEKPSCVLTQTRPVLVDGTDVPWRTRSTAPVHPLTLHLSVDFSWLPAPSGKLSLGSYDQFSGFFYRKSYRGGYEVIMLIGYHFCIGYPPSFVLLFGLQISN